MSEDKYCRNFITFITTFISTLKILTLKLGQNEKKVYTDSFHFRKSKMK